MKKILLFIIAISAISLQAQEHKLLKNRIAGLLSHSYLRLENGNYLAVPSFGLDYEHWINERIALGIFTDIELITNKVGTNSTNLNREFPLVITTDLIWKPVEKVELVIGPGVEIENGEAISLIRIGAEYDLHLGHHWDVAPSLFYDHKFEQGGAFSLGIGIGKSF